MIAKTRSPLVTISATFVVVGLAAIGYAATRKTTGNMSEDQTEKMTSIAVTLDGQIRAARLGVRLVSHNLSGVQKLRDAVALDAKAVENKIATGEISFLHRDLDEIVEFGRIVRETAKVEDLVIQPAGSPHSSHDGVAGSYADLANGKVLITEVVKVDPADRSGLYTGYLSMSRILDVGQLLKYLRDAGVTGKLVVGDKSTPIGPMSNDATTLELPIGSQPGIKLIVAGPPPHIVPPLSILIGGIVAATIGVLLLVINTIVRQAVARPRGNDS